MRKLACLTVVLCVSSAASASVLWRGDYESGDISQWSGYEGLPSRFSLVQSPVRQGKYALRVELHQGDVVFSGTRNEVSNEGAPEVEGNDRWYSWSTMFPAGFPAPQTWQVFTQWHHSGCCGSPPLEFDVLGETIQISHQGDTILWNTPLVRGVWHDFVIHVYFSPTAGFIEFWYDGVQALRKTAVQTLNPGESAYLKQGLYRDASIAPAAVIFHDGMTIGTTLADVAPQLVVPAVPPPAPADAGVPDAGAAGAPDAGSPAVDAGGAAVDAGAPTAPGDPQDAGVIAALPTDAGAAANDADAGTAPDPAATVPVFTSSLSGSGCSTTGAGVFALLGLLALALPRRRARRKRAGSPSSGEVR